MGKILLEGMEFFSYHGCFREEQIIGTKFFVTLEMDVDTEKAEKGDLLADTVNYQAVYMIVRKQMEQTSHLLEHVARRILDAVQAAYPEAKNLKIRISKDNPPVGGKMERVTVVLEQ